MKIMVTEVDFRGKINSLLSDSDKQTLIQRRADAEQIAENNGYTIKFMEAGKYELFSRMPDSGAVGDNTAINTGEAKAKKGVNPFAKKDDDSEDKKDDDDSEDKKDDDKKKVKEDVHAVHPFDREFAEVTKEEKDFVEAKKDNDKKKDDSDEDKKDDDKKKKGAKEGVVNAQTHATDNPPNYYDEQPVLCTSCGAQAIGYVGQACPDCNAPSMISKVGIGEGVVDTTSHDKNNPQSYYNNQGVSCPSCGWQGKGSPGMNCPVCGKAVIAMGAASPTTKPSPTLSSESILSDISNKFFQDSKGNAEVDEEGTGHISSADEETLKEANKFVVENMVEYDVEEVTDINEGSFDITFKTVGEQLLGGRSARAIYESDCFPKEDNEDDELIEEMAYSDIQDDLDELTIFGDELEDVDSDVAQDWMYLYNKYQRRLDVPQDSGTVDFIDSIFALAGN